MLGSKAYSHDLRRMLLAPYDRPACSQHQSAALLTLEHRTVRPQPRYATSSAASAARPTPGHLPAAPQRAAVRQPAPSGGHCSPARLPPRAHQCTRRWRTHQACASASRQCATRRPSWGLSAKKVAPHQRAPHAAPPEGTCPVPPGDQRVRPSAPPVGGRSGSPADAEAPLEARRHRRAGPGLAAS